MHRIWIVWIIFGQENVLINQSYSVIYFENLEVT